MAIARPFAYNTGTQILGTEQLGNLSIGAPTSGFTNNPQYWNGPDEELGYVIAQSVSGNTQTTPLSGVTASVGFFRSTDLTEGSFITLSETIAGQSFATGEDAKTWLNINGYWTSYVPVPVTPTNTPTNTTTRTPTPTVTPTITPSNTPYPPGAYQFYRTEGTNPIAPTYNGGIMLIDGGDLVTYNPNDNVEIVFTAIDKSGTSHPEYNDLLTYGGTITLTQGANTYVASGESGFFNYITSTFNYYSASYLDVIQLSANPFVSGSPIYLTASVNYPPTPTPSVTNTQTPSATPTLTPTPSTSPIPVTGYSFNLVQLPYNFPTSGNTIMTQQGIGASGTTNPNVMTIQGNGIYFNTFDVNGIDRASYFSSFIGQSITITMSQTGSTAIYSGSSTAFQSWVNSGSTGYVFGTGIAQSGFTSGTTVLIQSATTNFTAGLPVYISAVNNNPSVTPTPTATSVTPTPTPTSGVTSDGWFFYYADNQPVLAPPANNGDTAFIPTGAGFGTYNPNYTGGTLNMYFNNNNSVGTSYASQFSTLDTAGGTMTISQGSNTVIYSGTSTDYQSSGTFLYLTVSSPSQMIQSASTPFVSGTSINIVVS